MSDDNDAEPSELPRVLSLRDATMLVVSSVIGVGIFLTPGAVAKSVPEAGWFAFAWLLGGALSLAGALANAELGAMFPRAGGNYVYLRAAYHPAAGFLVGWLSFFAIFSGTIATLAVGFTISLEAFVPVTPAVKLIVATSLVWVASAVNAYATRAGAKLSTVTAYVKLVALFALVAIGPFVGHERAATTSALAPAGETSVASFGLALSPVLFSFLGWNASVYVAGEIEQPGKNLPRSLFWGLGICTAFYLLVNATYVQTLGMTRLADGPEGLVAVGMETGLVLFGPAGGRVVAALMLVSIFGCLSANVLVGPRIAYAMARDGLFFRVAAKVRAESRTPWVAVMVQAAVSTVLVIAFSDLSEILHYTTFAIVLATIADTLALYVLRARDPERPRPYKAKGYPFVPLLYLVANAAIAVAMLVGAPRSSLTSLGVLLSGLPIYLLFAERARRSPGDAGTSPDGG